MHVNIKNIYDIHVELFILFFSSNRIEELELKNHFILNLHNIYGESYERIYASYSILLKSKMQIIIM